MAYKSILSLGLGTRAVNCLQAEKIRFVHELAQWSEYELLRIPNFGKKCLGEVREALERDKRQLSPFSREQKVKIGNVAPHEVGPDDLRVVKSAKMRTPVFIAIVHHHQSDPFKSERVYFNLNGLQVTAVEQHSARRGPLSKPWDRWRVLVLMQPQPVVSWLEWRWLSKKGAFTVVSHREFNIAKEQPNDQSSDSGKTEPRYPDNRLLYGAYDRS